MLKGPTGCGKTRFVEAMAYKSPSAGDRGVSRRLSATDLVVAS